MNTEEALAQLGLAERRLTEQQKRELDENGYFIVPDVFSREEVAEMKAEISRLTALEGEYGGHEVVIERGAPRLANLFNKSSAFDRCLNCAPTLVAARYLLNEIWVYSLNARNPVKGEGQQPLHSDVPRISPTDWRLINSMVMLDDMTEDNGPTRVVPGSHKWPPINVPEYNLVAGEGIEISPEDRARIPTDPQARHPNEVHLTGKAGSVAVINGCIWHGGTRNESGASRQVLHLAISRRDVTQQTIGTDHLTEALYLRANPAQKYLLGIDEATPRIKGYPPLPRKTAQV
jgi:ectoine hydroxylase-related dioxygenase (phytanoyl-CoA dioxygenase family)